MGEAHGPPISSEKRDRETKKNPAEKEIIPDSLVTELLRKCFAPRRVVVVGSK